MAHGSISAAIWWVETPYMLKDINTKVGLFLLGGFLIITLMGLGGVYALNQFEEAVKIHTRTYQVLARLERLMVSLAEAESGQRGYLLTRNPLYLIPYEKAVNETDHTLDRLSGLAIDQEVQQKIQQIRPLVNQRLVDLQDAIDEAAVLSPGQVIPAELLNRGDVTTDKIHALEEGITERESVLLEERKARMQFIKMLCIILVVTAIMVSLAVELGAFGVIMREIRGRRAAREALATANGQLEQQLDRLNLRNSETLLLSRLISQLQSCQVSEEAFAAIAQFAAQLFPNSPGALYTYNASKDQAVCTAAWGQFQAQVQGFEPEDCWALRAGHVYRIDSNHPGLRCKHVPGNVDSYICVPMLAQGEPVGVLHVENPSRANLQESQELLNLANVVADQIAPCLINLRLRDTLRQQSIRDALTGLYNRRFLEESLKRETRIAERNQSAIGIIMIDLDHFKRLNDVSGHNAGDAVLAAVGQYLRLHTRGEDICCRYGGEELTVILPHTETALTVQKAQALCDGIRDLKVHSEGKTLQVTASMGVAVYPDHALLPDDLLKAADSALYKAKAKGRDRVELAAVPGSTASAMEPAPTA